MPIWLKYLAALFSIEIFALLDVQVRVIHIHSEMKDILLQKMDICAWHESMIKSKSLNGNSFITY